MTVLPATTAVHTSFTLPYAELNGMKMVTDEKAPVTLRFRARLLSGYNGRYSIDIGNGCTGSMHIGEIPGLAAPVALPNSSFIDQANDVFPVAGYTYITIYPDHNWLAPGQQFAAFHIDMAGPYPQADAASHSPAASSTDLLIGIQRPE